VKYWRELTASRLKAQAEKGNTAAWIKAFTALCDMQLGIRTPGARDIFKERSRRGLNGDLRRSGEVR
jgi:hypothetical protein